MLDGAPVGLKFHPPLHLPHSEVVKVLLDLLLVSVVLGIFVTDGTSSEVPGGGSHFTGQSVDIEAKPAGP